MATTYKEYLEQKLAKQANELGNVRAKMDADYAEKGAADSADIEKFDKIFEDGAALKAEIRKLDEAEKLIKFANGETEEKEEKQNPFLPAQKSNRSWGSSFTESEEFKAAAKSGFKKPEVDGVEVKAIYESTEATGGATVFSERRTTPIDQARLAPTTLLDILNTSPTNSNSIEWVAVTGFTNNAAEVAEYTGGNFGAKPQSDLTFDLLSTPVQTIAHWVAASRNVLSDSARMRNLIDTKLIQGLRRRLEGQVIAGNGTTPNLRGILATTGIQTRDGAAASASARYEATDTILDTVRRAITDVSLAFGMADAIVLHPADAEKMELMKDDNQNYMNVYDPVAQRVWRVRVVENRGITENEGVVGDFGTGATLFIRENAVIRVSESHSDFFIRNAIVVLAELRAALAVEEPEFFVHIDTLT